MPHWILTAICAVLGVVDILTFVKTPREKRTKLHPVLLVCGAAVLALAAFNAVRYLAGA